MSDNVQEQWEGQLAAPESGQHPEDMSDKPPRPESVYEARERLPPQVKSEIIGGELYVSPQPRTIHNRAAGQLFRNLGPFEEAPGGSGPGGWLFLVGPELHLHGDVLVPDLAGWRRGRMPELPDVVGVELPPDWVCEVLSPSTEARDRSLKMTVYAREGVRHLWFVDPRLQLLEVYRLEQGQWRRLGMHTGNATVHAEPFEALPLKLELLWQR